MERLPPELLATVCSFSNIRSSKKLRLVNKTFADIAAKFLFEALHVTLIPRYLHKVTEVAHHPTLRSHVRTLFFHYHILDQKFAEYETWKAEIDKAQYPQADLERCHTFTCDLLAEQKAFFDDRMDLPILSAALAMLPNLQTIGPNYAYLSFDVLEDLRDPILMDVQRNTLLENPFIIGWESRQPGLARPLVSLLSGLGLARRRVLNMATNAIPWSFWKEDGPSGVQNGALQFIHAAFRHLESMTACIVVDAYDLEVSMQGIMPLSITTFLGAAHCLRRLDLEFQCRKDCDRSTFEGINWLARRCPRTGPLFATLTLPSLAILSLTNCILTEESFIGFIERHVTTLKSLSLEMIVLDNQSAEPTSWERVWKQLAPLLSLDVIDLGASVDDEYLEGIIDCDLDLNPYYNAVEMFIYYRGQTKYPKWSEFLSGSERFPLALAKHDSDLGDSSTSSSSS